MPNKTVVVSAQMDSGFVLGADIRGHSLVIDQPTAAGGTDKGPTPLEYFLFSIAGCVASIGRIAAMQQRLSLRSMKVNVSGYINTDKLMDLPSADRTGFQQIRIEAEIDADMSEAEKQTFLDAICERCPLHDNVHYVTQVVHQLVGE